MCVENERPLSTASAIKGKFKRIAENPDVREAGRAVSRTVINTGISVLDFIPGIGEVPSGGADILKLVARGIRFGKFFIHHPAIRHILFEKLHLKTLDLTPDVSAKVAVLSELAEPLTGGIAPTHAAETVLQAKHDVPRIIKGVKSAIGILRGEIADYEKNPEIKDAMNAFEIDPPADYQPPLPPGPKK